MARTLFEKIWEAHVVATEADGTCLLYIDRHLVHEVTSPQAFEGLRLAGRQVRRPDLTFATMDHNVPTLDRFNPRDAMARLQMEQLATNCREFTIPLYGIGHINQGIVHVMGPELGLTLPGTTIVCGDSHTSTHGAFGALAFGIGTSEVEHVLATQCLQQRRPQSCLVNFRGIPARGVTAKDMILKLIGQIGTAGATGFVIEYSGEAVKKLSMEARMTLCNMSIEAGARAGLIAPDEVTLEYIAGGDRPFAPRGENLRRAQDAWMALATDAGACYDREIVVACAGLAPQVTWGTNPGMVVGVDGMVPAPGEVAGATVHDVQRALEYMGLEAHTKIIDIPIEVVFIGSCTNARLEDLRAAAKIIKGQRVAKGVKVLVVPGSERVRLAAEAEGLHEVFLAAGCEWRMPGCSMCLAMNPDRLEPGQRAAATSNRNFEGRQGQGGRTHLVSPEMAAAAAIAGHFVDVRELV